MTVKTAVDSAAIRAVGRASSAVFSSVDQIAIEMADLSNECAIEIAEAAEWRSLIRVAEMSGAASFPKPVDYDRMCVGQGILNKESWFWGYFAFQSIDQYLTAINGRLPMMQPGGWILLGDEFKFYPIPSGTAQFPYVSKHIVRANDGTLKDRFTSDDDSFVLSERLLTLCLLYRWKSQKGYDYGEDMVNFQTALLQDMNKDKGARVLKPDSAWRYPRTTPVYTGRTV